MQVTRDTSGEDAETGSIERDPGTGPLSLVARYLMPIDAQVLVARLQSDGLAARLVDADTVYANGALPLGGVRVMVPESQLAEAIRIRQSLDAGEFAIDEDFDVNQ